jgi:hypothetical protein
MDRRKFLKNSVMTCGALGLSSRIQATGESKTGGSQKIQYIREEIPHFEIPPYRGKSYEDKIPDTLDITEQLKLAVHGLTAIADPKADYEIYWLADFFRNPPVLVHDFNDWVQNQEGLMEALPLLRHATGDSLNSQVDQAWMASMLKSVGPDGLIYIPLNGRPWGRTKASGVEPVWRVDGTKTIFDDPSVSQFSSAGACGRGIATMTVYYLRDKNPMWKATIEKMIQRFSELAVDRGDYCYLPGGSFEPNATIDPRVEMPVGSLWGTTWNARLIQSLGQYYRVTGYEPARQLAAKLANYTRYHGQIFDSRGPWLLDPEIKGQKLWEEMKSGYAAQGALATAIAAWPPYVEGLTLGGHGHGHGIALLSLLEYASAVGDQELLQFCKASYEWLKNPGPSYGVSTLVGWFPEWYVPGHPACESCALGDNLGLAVKLTEASVGDYWDDVDRWVRNHFAEAQLTSSDWVYQMAEHQPRKPVAWNETAEHVPERNVGAWSGWTGANEWTTWIGIQHCCTGNAPRGLFYVWEHLVDYRNGELNVNLLLNRASQWADVHSYVPYQGRVDLRMKEACEKVRVRAPEWIETASPRISCELNGASRPFHWEGRYLNVGAARPGTVISVTFPIQERIVREKIGPETYTLVIKGNTVVSIDPGGKNGPLYQGRGKYRKSEVAWRQVKRFVPDETIQW